MAKEWPDQTYYPSCHLKLRIRFDNFVDSPEIKGLVPTTPSKNIKGAKTERSPLQAVPNPDGPGFVITDQAGPPGTRASNAGPGYSVGSSDGLTHEIVGVIPKKAEWHLNGIRTADTMAVEIRWSDMPFDPRLIRSCAVQMFLGVVPGQDFAAGVRGGTRTGAGSSAGQPLNLVPETYVDDLGRPRTNLRFDGWVDKWGMLWGADEPIVKLECADHTRLLIDQQWPASQQFDLTKPIDEAIAVVLSQFPQMRGFVVEYRPASVKSPVLGGILPNTAKVPKGGAPAAKGGGAAGAEQLNVWDHLTDIVRSFGHNIRVEGTTIIIQRATSLYNGTATSRVDDPYQGRTLPSGSYPVRAMIFGRNVLELEMGHEYARKKPTNIEVRSYCPRRKNMAVGRFPEKGDRIVHAPPGDGHDEKWHVVLVQSGISDEKLLKQMAEDYYNNVGRNQLSVRVKTKNLGSFGAGNADPDLLDLKAGDNFEILVNREPGTSVQTDREQSLVSPGPAAALLERLGYPPELAATYAASYAAAGLQKVFLVKEAAYAWDEEGVAIEVNGINYVEARVDKPLADPDVAAQAK